MLIIVVMHIIVLMHIKHIRFIILMMHTIMRSIIVMHTTDMMHIENYYFNSHDSYAYAYYCHDAFY